MTIELAVAKKLKNVCDVRIVTKRRRGKETLGMVRERYLHSQQDARRTPATASSARSPQRSPGAALPGPRLGAGPRRGGATEAERAPRSLAEEVCAGLRRWAGSSPSPRTHGAPTHVRIYIRRRRVPGRTQGFSR